MSGFGTPPLLKSTCLLTHYAAGDMDFIPVPTLLLLADLVVSGSMHKGGVTYKAEGPVPVSETMAQRKGVPLRGRQRNEQIREDVQTNVNSG